MDNQSTILLLTAATLGFVHTILGPDHYIPFIAMSRAGRWSKKKTLVVTVLSGMGHVFSSVILGLIGISAGIALNQVEAIESTRADIAAWLIISFGLIYFIWGLKQAYRKKAGNHHDHHHDHKKITPWIIFTIFVLGPCEPLIPLLIYPAVTENIYTLITVIIVFSSATVITMTGIVTLGLYSVSILPLNYLEKYIHAIAGLLILLCGFSIKFLGL